MIQQRNQGGYINMTVSEFPEAPGVTQDPIEEVNKEVENYFASLASINVKNYIEKKNNFSYLSWAYAVDQLKRKHPDAKIIVKRFPEPTTGIPVPYLQTPIGYFVEVEVIVNGVSVSEPFPVTDHRNKTMMSPTAFDINSSIQRAKVKSIAGHGLGLYIYAGEDLPIDDPDINSPQQGGYQQQNNNGYQQQQQNYQQQNYQQQSMPPQVAMMSPEQQQEMKDIAIQIANLNLGPDATHDGIIAQMKDIYERHTVSANMPFDLAKVKITAMQNELKAVIESRMTPNNQAPQQVPAQLFATPTENLANVI